MLKRQDSTFLSSSRRETPPPNHHAKSVGCMSGILHLLSKYQHRHRRKFLTFGKKHDAEYPHSTKRDPALTKKVDQNRDCVVRRNPAEIRRLSSADSPEVNFRSSPALLERLMGLPSPRPEATEHRKCSSISWEERRKLMSDLDKCDEDLKELKRMIESVRNSECVRSPSVVNEKLMHHDLTRSPLISATYSKREATKCGRMSMAQAQKAAPRKKPGEDEALDSLFILHKPTMVEPEPAAALPPGSLSSKAMKESVEEVCNEIGSGEKREVGGLGLAMQDCICTDLIEEFVKDLLLLPHSLPFQACRRKLCF